MKTKFLFPSLLFIGAAIVIGFASLQNVSAAEAPKTLPDGRVLLVLPAKDKALMMDRMRGALGLVQGILVHAGKGNWPQVESLAHHLSNQGIREDMKNFSGPPPVGFLKMAQPLHALFDEIEKDAKEKKDAAHTTAQIAEALGYCSACHAAFTFNP